ncbi:unnamed protein product [Effrenium voratum]|uniref:Uncharacterized protein n=1 Tax=Effrenium voratum TaxID=2562239 RepID=A0AA36I5X9_9DINO|nr:unnamed protein product [Effrenium voratum]
MPRDDDFEDDFEDNSRDFEEEGFEDEGFEDDAGSGLGSEGDYSEAEKEGDDQTARQTGMPHEEYSMDLDAEADASDADAPANAPETDNPDTPAPADAHAYSDAEADAYADAYEDEADEPSKARHGGMARHETEDFSMDDFDPEDADASNANAQATDKPASMPAADAEADAEAAEYEEETEDTTERHNAGNSHLKRLETEDYSMADMDESEVDAEASMQAQATDRHASMDAEADADASEYEEEAEDTAERHNAGHSRLKRLETEEYFLDEEADAAPLGSTQKLPEEAAEGSLGNEDLLEAVQRFRAGRFAEASELARKAVENCQGALGAESPPETEGDAEADAWRAAMDRLAGAHEACGDVERAEALYLRMLAWREGAEQVEAGNCKVGETLFKKSCHYRSVEDATWFLHTLRPDDGHAGAEAVALLALGEEVAAKAAVAVWTLALRASQREQLTQCGAVELMAKALAFHPGPELQAAGCGVLRLLCSGHRLAAQNRRMLISRLGGAESVTNAMRAHPQDMEVMREACGALRAMAHKNPAGARRIIDNDGFKLCMEAIESPDEAVAGAACKAIAAMQCAAQAGFKGNEAQAENVQAVWEAKLRENREVGLRSCQEKLKGHLQSRNRVALEAVLAISSTFMEDLVRYKFMGMVSSVVACMQMFPTEKIQVPACKILFRLTSNESLSHEHEEAIQKLAKCNGIGPVVQAMKDLPCHAPLQRLAIGAVRNFVQAGDMNKTCAARAGGIPATITAMQRFPKDVELQELAVSCLTNLCDTLGRAAVAARLGAIENILAAMKSTLGDGDGRLTELSCIILCMFSDDQKLRQHILKAGATAAAKQVISRAKNADAQRWGCELLRNLDQSL